ncbi:MAG: hypothetical protein ACRC35_02180 [Angustibacter sp.]
MQIIAANPQLLREQQAQQHAQQHQAAVQHLAQFHENSVKLAKLFSKGQAATASEKTLLKALENVETLSRQFLVLEKIINHTAHGLGQGQSALDQAAHTTNPTVASLGSNQFTQPAAKGLAHSVSGIMGGLMKTLQGIMGLFSGQNAAQSMSTIASGVGEMTSSLQGMGVNTAANGYGQIAQTPTQQSYAPAQQSYTPTQTYAQNPNYSSNPSYASAPSSNGQNLTWQPTNPSYQPAALADGGGSGSGGSSSGGGGGDGHNSHHHPHSHGSGDGGGQHVNHANDDNGKTVITVTTGGETTTFTHQGEDAANFTVASDSNGAKPGGETEIKIKVDPQKA